MAQPATYRMENVTPLPCDDILARILGLENVMRVQDPELKQTEGGKPRWFIRPYVDEFNDRGELVRVQKRIYLGAVSDKKKRDAVVEKNRVMAVVNRSQFVAASQVNFDAIIDIYLKQHVRRTGVLSASTQAKYENHIANHIRPALGPLSITAVDTRCIDRLMELKSGLAWATRCDLRNIVSAIFTKAQDWGLWSGDNPARRVTVGRKRAAREKRRLTVEQTTSLFDALPGDVSLICQVALFCGLRISEVMGLQVKHVDLIGGVVYVHQRWYRGDLDVVKSDRARRTVPLGLLADRLQWLIEARDKEEFTFSVTTHYRNGRPRPIPCRDDRDILQHFLRPAAQKLGIYYPGFGFHSFRREAVTHFVSQVGEVQTMKMAGHSKVDMTELYSYGDAERQRLAVVDLQAKHGLSQIEPEDLTGASRHRKKRLKTKEMMVGSTELESVTSTVSR